REDLQSLAHILKLIASYEEGMDQDLEQQIRTVYKFLIKMNDLHLVQNKIMSFIRNLNKIYDYQLKNAFIKLRELLIPSENQHYEKCSFIDLNIISRPESKREEIPVKDIIKKKFARRKRAHLQK